MFYLKSNEKREKGDEIFLLIPRWVGGRWSAVQPFHSDIPYKRTHITHTHTHPFIHTHSDSNLIQIQHMNEFLFSVSAKKWGHSHINFYTNIPSRKPLSWCQYRLMVKTQRNWDNRNGAERRGKKWTKSRSLFITFVYTRPVSGDGTSKYNADFFRTRTHEHALTRTRSLTRAVSGKTGGF